MQCHRVPPPPDKYAVRFIPREKGVHNVHVTFNGAHIPGSPFQVRVGEPGHTGDPGLVSAYGTGLEKGTTGPSVCPSCLVFPFCLFCLSVSFTCVCLSRLPISYMDSS